MPIIPFVARPRQSMKPSDVEQASLRLMIDDLQILIGARPLAYAKVRELTRRLAKPVRSRLAQSQR